MESRRPSTTHAFFDVVIAGSIVGTIVGAILATFDFVAAGMLQSAEAPELIDRLRILSLLPAFGAVFGLLSGMIPSGRRYLFFPVVVLWIGVIAAQGPRAAKMPLASQWGVLSGLFALLVAASISRHMRRRKSTTLRMTLLLVAVSTLAIAAYSQRGRYFELRAVTCLFAAGLLTAALGDRFRGISRWSGLLVCGSCLIISTIAGIGALHDRRAVVWAVDDGTAIQWLAQRGRSFVVRHGGAAPSSRFDVPGVIGSPIGRESSAIVASAGGIDGMFVICIDSLRHDLIGAEIGGRRVTPFIDEQIGRGTYFDRAYCAAPSSCLSILSMFSGLSASRIADHPAGVNQIPLVIDAMRAEGIDTAACFSSSIFTLSPRGFDRPTMGFERSFIFGEHDPDLATIEARLLSLPGSGRWFRYLHLMRPHDPYDDAAPEFRSGKSSLERQAAEIRQCDAVVKDLFALLDREGRLDRTLIVLMSDHGEEHGEHGQRHHGSQLFEESIRVPLAFVGPGVVQKRISTPVSLIDIASTVAHVFDLETATASVRQGRSLLPLVTGLDDVARVPLALVECPPIGVVYRPVLSACVGERWKLIVDHRLETERLYDLASDSKEQRNLAFDLPARVAELRADLVGLRDRRLGEAASTAQIDEERDVFGYGDQLEPDRIADLLSRLTESEPHVFLSAACYVADIVSADEVRRLEVSFRDSADQRVRLALSLLRFSAGLERAGDAERLIAELSNTRAAITAGGIYRAFSRRRDPRVLDVETSVVASADMRLSLDIDRVGYRAAFEDSSKRMNLAMEAMRHPNPWFARRGVELAAGTSEMEVIDAIVDVLDTERRRFARVPRLQGAGMRALAMSRDDRALRELSTGVADPIEWVREQAYAGLLDRLLFGLDVGDAPHAVMGDDGSRDLSMRMTLGRWTFAARFDTPIELEDVVVILTDSKAHRPATSVSRRESMLRFDSEVSKERVRIRCESKREPGRIIPLRAVVAVEAVPMPK